MMGLRRRDEKKKGKCVTDESVSHDGVAKEVVFLFHCFG